MLLVPRTRFSEDRSIGPAEWASIVQEVVGLPVTGTRLVTPVNLSTVVLLSCVDLDRVKVARSFRNSLALPI